jgi:TetR/AcrR family transcriptional repressor of bet genes
MVAERRGGAVPRTADHEARRSQILDAVCRITIRGGLEAATFRQIAAEASVSVRLVQYYFGTKERLLDAAHDHVLSRSAERLRRAIRDLPAESPPAEVVGTAMRSFLPTDAAGREAMVLFYAFFAAQLTDDRAAGAEVDRGNGLTRLLAHHIARGQRAGLVAADVDPDSEATILYLMLPSLASAVIAGGFGLDAGQALIDYAVDRVFTKAMATRTDA